VLCTAIGEFLRGARRFCAFCRGERRLPEGGIHQLTDSALRVWSRLCHAVLKLARHGGQAESRRGCGWRRNVTLALWPGPPAGCNCMTQPTVRWRQAGRSFYTSLRFVGMDHQIADIPESDDRTDESAGIGLGGSAYVEGRLSDEPA